MYLQDQCIPNEQVNRTLKAFLLKSKAGPICCIVLATMVVWGRSLGFDFVWDDGQFILEAPAIRSLSNLPAMFSRLDAQSSLPEGFVLFRPLRTLHYAILVALGGGEPRPVLFHLANLCWHGLNAWLLFQCVVRWGGGRERMRGLGFGVALGWLVMPVHAEVVCWAKGLDDLMATAGVLASAACLSGRSWSRKAMITALVAFVFALYSKVSALPWIVGPFVAGWFLGRGSKRQAWILGGAFLSAAVLFLIHRHLVIGQSHQTAPISGSYLSTLIDMAPVMTLYVRLLLGIPPFCADYTWMTGGYTLRDVPVWLGVGILWSMVGCCCWALSRSRWKPAGWAGLWFLAFLVPVSNLIPMMQYAAERFLYLPSIGWVVALAWAVMRCLEKRSSLVPGLVLVPILWAALAFQRAGVWKDDLTLFLHEAGSSPVSRRVVKNAVSAVFKLPVVTAVLSQDPETGMLSPRAGARREDYQAMELALESVADRLSGHSDFVSALGLARALQGDVAGAVGPFAKAAELKPDQRSHWMNLARACSDAGFLDQAGEALDRADRLRAGQSDALGLRGRVAWMREDWMEAERCFSLLAEREPDQPEHLRWRDLARERLGKANPVKRE